MAGLNSSFAMDVNEPETVQFEAITGDVNLLLSRLTFESTVVNTYTLTLLVQNNVDRDIETVASITVTTVPTLTTASSGNVSGLLPFNALYLWVTVGVLVGLITIALCIRRCVSDKDREPVMTNEERHILNKVRAGAGLLGSAGERLDGGIMRTSTAGVVLMGNDSVSMDGVKARKGVVSRSEEKEGEADEKQQTVPTLISFFGGGGKSKRGMRMTPSNEEGLGMIGVLPQAMEASHLGSRIDTELWGQHVGGHATLPQPQHRGVQLIPTATGDLSQLSAAVPFDPYATANLVPYEAMQTQPVSLSITQMLSSSLTGSQLLAGAPIIEEPTPSRRVPRILTPTGSSADAQRAYTKSEHDEKEAVATAQSNFRLLHAAYSHSIQRSLTPTHLTPSTGSLVGVYSAAGVLASPRLNPMPAAASAVPPIKVTRETDDEADTAEKPKLPSGSEKERKWKADKQTSESTSPQPTLSHRRARTATNVEYEPLQLEGIDNTPPARTTTVITQPRSAAVSRASSVPSSMSRGRMMTRSSHGVMDGVGIEVPVNPMLPVHSDTPRYKPEVYNTLTKRRQLSLSGGSGSAVIPRDSPSSGQADDDVVDNINRQHPLFEHNRMRSTLELSVDDEEEN